MIEDTKGVIRKSVILRTDNAVVNKVLHIKLKNEQREHHTKRG